MYDHGKHHGRLVGTFVLVVAYLGDELFGMVGTGIDKTLV